jgi:hypothetical protein
MADLRHLLATYVHAHQTGNSVPPHIDAEARAVLATDPPAPRPTTDDIWELCEDHEFHLGDGFNDEESAEGLLQIIEAALARWGNPAPAEPVATLHVSDFRGYENYDFQHLVDLPPGHYKLFTACTAQPPESAEPDTDAVLTLAAIIRESAGNGLPGAARLAELILSHPNVASVFQPPAPAPADHVPGARNMVPADEKRKEREELAQWLDHKGRGAWPCPDGFSAEAEAEEYEMFSGLTRAAALLRQLPPAGLEAIRYCVEEDGAVIQRTSQAPESWAIRAGSSCMSTTGEWDIEPMPSNRTDEWLAKHRWPTLAAAWAALQQARRQEVGDA